MVCPYATTDTMQLPTAAADAAGLAWYKAGAARPAGTLPRAQSCWDAFPDIC